MTRCMPKSVRARALALVHTSVDDCRSSLPHADDDVVYAALLIVKYQQPQKTKEKILQREADKRYRRAHPGGAL